MEESVCSQAAPRELYVGIDVGSTTVKLVALDVQSQECVPLISRYVRHGARQAEIAAKLLEEQGVPVKLGVFGADMKIRQFNDGPVTILYEC